MKSQRILFFLKFVIFTIAIGLISCKKDKVDNPRIVLEADELNVGELEIYKTLSATDFLFSELQIQIEVDWISYEYHSNLIHFTFSPNQTNNKRSAKITFLKDDKVIDELTVNQEVFALKYPEGALNLNDISYSTNLTIDNMPVTSDCMCIYGFSENYNLDAPGAKEIIIPPYYFVAGKLRMVGIIDYNAFENKNLTKVILPELLSTIYSNAFKGNQLTEINLGKNLDYIDWNAFANNKLVEINIPNTLRYIGHEAFSNNLLEKVTIGSGVTEIGENAFQFNNKLCEVINNSSLVLTQEMFPKCPVGQCGIVSDYVFGFKTDLSYDETIVVNYVGTSLEAFIPNSVKIIGSSAFYNKSLTAITLPPYLTTIQGGAFASNKIKSVSFNANIELIGQSAFANNEILQVSFENNSKLKRIDSFAFYNCSASSIVLPTNINPGFHHYEDSDHNVVTEISNYNKSYYACKEDGTRIE